jgi:hypothetical protein
VFIVGGCRVTSSGACSLPLCQRPHHHGTIRACQHRGHRLPRCHGA